MIFLWIFLVAVAVAVGVVATDKRTYFRRSDGFAPPVRDSLFAFAPLEGPMTTLIASSTRCNRLVASRLAPVSSPSQIECSSFSPGFPEAGATSIAHALARYSKLTNGTVHRHLEIFNGPACADRTRKALQTTERPRPTVSAKFCMRAFTIEAAAIRCAISLVGVSVGVSSCSSTPSPVALSPMAAEASARISAGMTRLGASLERSDCYANQIAIWLTDVEQAEAVRIVEASTTKEDMRSGVLAAPNRVSQSFVRAHFGCSLYR